MPIIQTRTIVSCKICGHSRREEIEALLELRASGEIYESTGKPLTYPILLGILADEFGMENPTSENARVHLSNHCEIVTDEEYQSRGAYERDAALELAARYEREGNWNADNMPRRMVEIAGLRIQKELLDGKLPKVSADQAQRFIDTATKRKQGDAQSSLLESLALGIGGAIVRSLEPGKSEDADYMELEDGNSYTDDEPQGRSPMGNE